MDEERTLELIEYGVEALLLGAFTYLFAYQNYLLYRWHRGLPLPSKLPFLIIGAVVGLGFFLYKSREILKEVETRQPEVKPVKSGEKPLEGDVGSPEESDFSQWSD
ncbi:membrane protein [Thermococcus guaymasensis DSM 11113]|uniref:Membrane protein n=1 Tax=Thermococcus guaymasensis DSM 11113 TaxID=1432656 RepID=A0A0X1KLC8_9EURY|nr:hypothetical protein [Thermococcus guaymasensis]AJC72081.1 membrane protein [Thermococcus guaymasensis DSM 11113]